MAKGCQHCLGYRRDALRARADEQLPPPRVRVRLIRSALEQGLYLSGGLLVRHFLLLGPS